MAKDTTKTTEVQETPEVTTLQAGDCKKEECRCLHEHGLVEVIDANGVHSQLTVEQAKNRLAEVESIRAALGEVVPAESEAK